MVEVVGKSNDPVVQCENCRNLVKIQLGSAKWIPSNSIKAKSELISSYLPRLKDL